MPYTLNWEPAGAYAHFHGKVDVADLQNLMLGIVGNSRFDSLRYLLCDYLDVTSHSVTDKQTEVIAALDYAQRLTNSRFAHVAVATEPGDVALITHWIASSDHSRHNFHCSTLAEAREVIAAFLAGSPGHAA